MPFWRKKYNFKLKKGSIKDKRALNTSRYNVLIFIDNLDSDMARNIIDITNGLIKRNVNVIILASSIKFRRKLAANVEVMILNVVVNKLMPFFMKIVYVQNICNINKIDIILVTSAKCAYIANQVAKNLHIKFVTYINELWDVKDKFSKKYNEIMLKSDLMLLPSLYICDYILDNYDYVNHEKMKLVRGGIDINMFNIENVSDGRKMDAIKYLGENVVGKYIFLCLSKFVDNNGQMPLLRAIARLIERGAKNFICVLVDDFAGSNNYRHNLVNNIKKLGIEKYVLLSKTFDDVPALYSLSYVVLSLSNSVALSARIIAEAGAMHRYTIIAHVRDINDYVISDKSGYVVDPNNIANISNTMEKILMQNREQYKTMCEHAHQCSLKYFDIRNTIIELDDALCALVM